MKESITALIQASSVRKVRWQLILPSGVRVTLYRLYRLYIHMHVCVRHAIKESRNVDVKLNLSYINKCKIAVRRKTLCGRVRSKKVFLKGNKSSLQHRWREVLLSRKAARWRKGPFQLETGMTSPFYERWVWCWKAAMKIRRQIQKTPVSLWKVHSKQPLAHGSKPKQRWESDFAHMVIVRNENFRL